MKRKFLSTLLFGALACTTLSTVTSCKDYDDDINNLQEQIDKKAALDKVNDLITQVSNVETQAKSAYDLAASKASKEDVAAAQTAATEAAKKAAQEIADAASTKADAAAAAAKAAQETADKAVADAAAANKAAEEVAGKLKDYVLASELKTQLENLKKELEDGSIKELEDKVKGYDNAINALYSAVTEVSLVGTFHMTDGASNMFKTQCDLQFITGKTRSDEAYTFGVEEKDEFGGKHSATPQYAYAKNGAINFPTSLIVRVNPINAQLSADMVKLINSKGEDLSKILKVVSVEPYEKLLTTTRATSKGGLWKINLQLVDGVEPTEENGPIAATLANGKSILYAVAVNNTAAQAKTNADAADRYVVSTYDVTVGNTKKYQKETTLDNVAVYPESTNFYNPTDIANKVKYLSDVESRHKSGEAVTVDHKGNTVNVANGENIVIDFSGATGYDRFYVVLDKNYAGGDNESQDSEIKAWESYTINGTNKIVAVAEAGGTATVNVTIPGSIKDGDKVAFRIFAVNYDGTVIPATGASFVAFVGNKATAAAVTGELAATGVNKFETGWLPITGTLKNGKGLPGTVTLWDGAKAQTLKVEYATAPNDNSKVTSTNGVTDGEKNKDVKYAKFTLTSEASDWADDQAAAGTISTENSQNLTENSIAVSLKKVMPTEESTKKLMGYNWKASQLKNGVYTAYMYPASVTSPVWSKETSNGYKDMTQAINGLTNDKGEYQNGFEIVIKNAKLKKVGDDQVYADTIKLIADNKFVIEAVNKGASNDVELIDNTTEHETNISFNYGKISSANPKKDYVVNVETVKTIFACPLNEDAQKYEWVKKLVSPATKDAAAVYADMNNIVYGKEKQTLHLGQYLKASNAFDNAEFGGLFTKYIAKTDKVEESWVAGVVAKYLTDGVKAELKSKSTGTVDYYTVKVAPNGDFEFTPISEKTNVVEDVPSTLILKMKDAFGHTNKYEMDFTVLKSK